MNRDARWPERCTLSGCTNPALRPHHHHMQFGHLTITACRCASIDQPGTRPLGGEQA